jgi:hypothetical protein
MEVLAGPQGTSDEREELAELAGILGMVPASDDTDWTDVQTLYVTSDYIKCGTAVALVEIVAGAYGVLPVMIDI